MRILPFLPLPLPLLLTLAACPDPKPDTGDSPSETGDSTDSGDSDFVDLVCDDSYQTPPADLVEASPYWKPGDPLRYRVVEVESDLFDPLLLVVYFPEDPTATVYAEGAPVVVTARPAMATAEADASANVPGAFGLVEVQPVYPIMDLQGVHSEGPPDSTGLEYAEAFRQAMRFAAGEIPTVEGWTISQVAERPTCGPGVVVLTGSSGAFTALAALDAYRDELLPLLGGIASYEPPSVVQFATGDGGWIWMDPDDHVDADGDGSTWDDFRNPTYTLGACAADSPTCAFDHAGMGATDVVNLEDLNDERFARAPGEERVLYLDRDGSGSLSLTRAYSLDLDGDGALGPREDFFFSPHHDPDAVAPWNKQYYSPPVLEAAVAQGILDEADWPSGMATPTEAAVFWEQRNPVPHIVAIRSDLSADVQVVVVYTEVDHAVALPTRPSPWQYYETFRTGGATVRYNPSLASMACAIGPTGTTLSGLEPAAGTSIAEESLPAYALLEEIPSAVARSIGAVGVVWGRWGPFDGCPGEDE